MNHQQPAPRDHTIAFRIRDAKGKFCSNVVWLLPDGLAHLAVDDIRGMVDGELWGRAHLLKPLGG